MKTQALLASALLLTACGAHDGSPDAVGEDNTALTGAANQIYWGYYVDQWWKGADTTYIDKVGKTGSIFHFYDNMGAAFNPGLMTELRGKGYIPLVSYQPWGGKVTDPAYTSARIIAGEYDAQLVAYAQGAKAWGHPFFFRFAHEMNGNWYPWADDTNGNKVGEYVEMYRHVHDLFAGQGVTNATWVWCPNVDYSGSEKLSEVYPGDDYVDWTCFDGYYESWNELVGQTYQDLLALAPGKPIMVGETGYGEKVKAGQESKASWYTDVLTNELPKNYPAIKALVMWNQNAYVVDSSAASLAAFKAGIASPFYATNTFASLTGSKIAPLYTAPASAVVSIENTNSGKCVDLPGGSTVDGQQMQQWTCGETDRNQLFTVTKTSAGLYRFESSASHKCVELRGGSAVSDTPIAQSECGATNANQELKLTTVRAGVYTLETDAGDCVDIAAASVANGALVQGHACNGTGAQTFSLVVREGTLP